MTNQNLEGVIVQRVTRPNGFNSRDGAAARASRDLAPHPSRLPAPPDDPLASPDPAGGTL